MFPALFFISSLAAASVLSPEKFKWVSLGMKKDEIISTLGYPDSIQTEGLNEEGKLVEKLEYSVGISSGMPAEGYSMSQRYGGESRSDSHSTQQYSSNDACSLVLINETLVRIEKKPEKTEKNSGDYRPRMNGGNGASLNL